MNFRISTGISWGPSPPTRGSLLADIERAFGWRSIPAHAGKPPLAEHASRRPAVHPRPRGEAIQVWKVVTAPEGPSPPTRGSHPCPIRWCPRFRSIPAHAGKPQIFVFIERSSGVHPRPRGEAGVMCSATISVRGPSPPTRGSLVNDLPVQHDHGSIPAHAGKPEPVPAPRPLSGVHPRPRGEATCGPCCASRGTGPSPPTRGSHPRAIRRYYMPGSIPAHAGKPRASAQRMGLPAVHPRPRGEAFGPSFDVSSYLGPSPPTRGSPSASPDRQGAPGSIPAHAGKPLSRSP